MYTATPLCGLLGCNADSLHRLLQVDECLTTGRVGQDDLIKQGSDIPALHTSLKQDHVLK